MIDSESDSNVRHACHALEDFKALREHPDDDELWHSLSHHLRHAEYRVKKERDRR
jgi:hypothetical protein